MRKARYMKRKYALTFDIDWAPDFVILKCLELLEKENRKATFFATHDTPINREIVLHGHNLGIHPNFLPRSSQGSDVETIISECLRYAPDAWCMRSHALVQSSPLLYEIFSKFPQLKLDVSLFMHQSHFAHKVSWNFDGISFDRLLYNWEDDAQFFQFGTNPNPELFLGDLTVFNFHPMHVFLNSSDGNEYRRLKIENANTPLFALDINVASNYINTGVGTQNYLREVIASHYICTELGDI